MEEASSPPALDLEASQLTGQLASAVLDLQGKVVRSSRLSQHDASILYQMLVEAASLPEMSRGDFYRMTVTFPSIRYVVARDENNIYIVQGRN